jgi:hypothetical protein
MSDRSRGELWRARDATVDATGAGNRRATGHSGCTTAAKGGTMCDP